MIKIRDFLTSNSIDINVPWNKVHLSSQNSTNTGLRHRGLFLHLIMWGSRGRNIGLLLRKAHMLLTDLGARSLITDGSFRGDGGGVGLTHYTAAVSRKLLTDDSLCVKILGQVGHNVVHQLLDNLFVFVLQVGMDTGSTMSPNTWQNFSKAIDIRII